ncbi:GNAT family N-acetyltransferase [Paucibacter sp. Y2R2-4]|uniref:GNAT family N-acetyltransferase n=1 Tax=Paucibacter sp. Y2R2-4 TaxID=2893553 RepID=UPI0021E4CE0A|nr:GNAT family N-acetyltransferase [Paucibacter sp. Y2R2-4]MCV2350448.1 GNAT family N-acetyltransferase [Paucibacter sp. Y2R2-4]
MLIRTAIPSDVEAIARVHVATWKQAYSHILPAEFLAKLPVEKRRSMWAKSVAEDLPHVLVAELDGEVVGFSAIGPCRDEGSSSSDFEIWAIYLSPSHWSLGLGRELWEASRTVAANRGASSVSLWVFADNERAIRFYQKAGFTVDNGSRKTFEFGGIQLQEVRCVRRLDGEPAIERPCPGKPG